MPDLKSVQFQRSLSQHAKRNAPTGVFGQANITIEAWFRLNSLGVNQVIYNLGTVSSASQICAGLYVISTNKLFGRIGIGASDITITGNTTLSTGIWYHGALTYNGSSLNLYLGTENNEDISDATPVSASGTLNTPNTSNDTVYLGARGLTDETNIADFFDGLINEVIIWNTARTLSQLNSDRCGNITGSESGCIGYYALEDNFNDSSPNANHLTPSGSPTFSTIVQNPTTCPGKGEFLAFFF